MKSLEEFNKITDNTFVDDINNFEKSDILNSSEVLFDLFNYNDDDVHFLNEKVEIIEAFIKSLNKALYSDLIKTKPQKVAIMKTITKLKMQQEILELLQSEDVEKAIKNLKETAERFGKKAQSSVRKVT